MSDNAADPFLAETAFDVDEWTDEPFEGAADDEDELDIEEDRAQER